MTHPLTLLSWNLFLGSGAPANFFEHLRKHWNVFFYESGPRFAIDPVCALIREYECDVLCLQEVDGGSFRNGYRNVVAEIAERSGLSHFQFAAQRQNHCNDGIALLSRKPLLDVTSVILVHDFEQRGLIRARLDLGTRDVWVAVTHLAAPPLNALVRRRQAEQICRELHDRTPLLLAADFNCEPNSKELSPLRERLGLRAAVDAASFPAYKPRYRLDNVFVSGDIEITHAEVSPVLCSDHLPVIVKVRC